MPIKKVIIDKANRIYQMPPSILASIRTEKKHELLKRPDLIDLASFAWPIAWEPDWTPDVEGLKPATQERLNNLKEELAGWLANCHHIKLVPEKEIFIGGSITSLVHYLALAYIDNGDVAFVPDVAIPLYRQAVFACSGEPIGYTISARNDWHPGFDRIQTRLARIARVLFLNSPHNPTGCVLDERDLSDLAWLASRENILIINDAAYQGIPDRTPPSLLSAENGKKVGVEVYSFAYQFGLPPIPFGFVVGNREIISGLRIACSLVPPFIPDYYITMALEAIRQFPSAALKAQRNELRRTLAENQKLLEHLELDKSGYDTVPYVWARLEKRSSSATAARLLFKRYRILTAPGTSFGEGGKGYLRFSLTTGSQAYTDAVARLKHKSGLLTTQEDE